MRTITHRAGHSRLSDELKGGLSRPACVYNTENFENVSLHPLPCLKIQPISPRSCGGTELPPSIFPKLPKERRGGPKQSAAPQPRTTASSCTSQSAAGFSCTLTDWGGILSSPGSNPGNEDAQIQTEACSHTLPAPPSLTPARSFSFSPHFSSEQIVLWLLGFQIDISLSPSLFLIKGPAKLGLLTSQRRLR